MRAKALPLWKGSGRKHSNRPEEQRKERKAALLPCKHNSQDTADPSRGSVVPPCLDVPRLPFLTVFFQKQLSKSGLGRLP